MNNLKITIDGFEIPVYFYNTVVVGTGAAGFNAADRLYGYGQKDIAIVTEHICAGTSRNTGSDKQTYYKLAMEGGERDSIRDLARTLFDGQCVDGDIAWVEAALSAQCFLKLVELGVRFPVNRYGEFIGYKTDHDPRKRATSAGPLTSKLMTEALEKEVLSKGIPVYDKHLAIKILKNGSRVCGLLCLNLDGSAEKGDRYSAFCCKNIIYATGGPAGIYADSVYPAGHHGSSGVAFSAGAIGKNLTEWQYGLASVNPRWNVSGTYMQSLPRFISTNSGGTGETEFLEEYFKNPGELLTKVFLKGYEWPFDIRKAASGSSVIDILVYIECCMKGRRVFLDYTRNPGGLDFSLLSSEARTYLEKAGALFGTPIERLSHMNMPAVDFYRSRGVDLAKEPLEIALCAQHNNGGLDIDMWWQTNIEGLFAVGEAAASHGVYRPGGSALNAGQVGSARAARFIASNRTGAPDSFDVFAKSCTAQIRECVGLVCVSEDGSSNAKEILRGVRKEMSRIAAAIRFPQSIKDYIVEVKSLLQNFKDRVRIREASEMKWAYILHDTLITQYMVLNAMKDYADAGGKSRGSALYSVPEGERIENLPELFSFITDDGCNGDKVQVGSLNEEGNVHFHWRPVRPLPSGEDFFENVWREFRKNGNVY